MASLQRSIQDLLQSEYLATHVNTQKLSASVVQGTKSSSKKQADEKTEEEAAKSKEFAAWWRVVKQTPGALSSIEESSVADPGCQWEVSNLSLHLCADPFVGEPLRADASTFDIKHPTVRAWVEAAREAHWKLTAPKGFAALQGIPELQQLLAYTAADVVQYAANNDVLGEPGVWRRPVGKFEPDKKYTDKIQLTCLSDGASLIGQLCPGLRLCLAAEVATGLMCGGGGGESSHPLPPDTPEHAAALLLFVDAARQQAEQECQDRTFWPAGGSWRLNPSLGNCKALADFYACPGVDSLLLPLLGLPAGSGGDGSSSSSGSSSAATPLHVPHPSDVGGSVVRAVCGLVQQVVAAATAGHEQQQQQDAPPPPPQQPPPPRQHQQHPPQQQQLEALVSETQVLVNSYMDSLLSQIAAPSSSPSTATATATAAAGATDACSSSSSASQPPAVADVAWQVTVVCGAMAVWLLKSELPAVLAPAVTAALPVCAALLVTQIQALQESVAEVLQGVAAHTTTSSSTSSKQQRGGVRRGQQQQAVPQAARLVSTSSSRQAPLSPPPLQQQQCHQTDTGAAIVDDARRTIAYKMLELLEAGRLYRDLLCDICSSSSGDDGSGGSSAARTDLVAEMARHSLRMAARAVALEEDKSPGWQQQLCAGELQMLAVMPHCPAVWFQHAFSIMGQQQCRITSLHPFQREGGQDAAGVTVHAAATGGSGEQGDEAAAASAEALSEAAKVWDAFQADLQPHAAEWHNRIAQAYAAQQQQQHQGSQQQPAAASVNSSSSHSMPGHSSSTGGATGDPAAAPAAAAERDQLLQALSPEAYTSLLSMMRPTRLWQAAWLRHAITLAEAAVERDGLLQFELMGRMSHMARRRFGETERLRREAEKRKRERQEKKQEKKSVGAGKKNSKAVSAGSKQQQKGREEEEFDFLSSMHDRFDKDSKKDADEDDNPAPARIPCPLCAAEQAAAAAGAAAANTTTSSSTGGGSSTSTSSGSNSNSSASSPPSYSRFPVAWSDPFLMRRLLWNLLGRLKPSAQQWLVAHVQMCPHSMQGGLWTIVAMCLARHIWGPPGEWDADLEAQQALIIPMQARLTLEKLPPGPAAAEELARMQYAHMLNASFAHQHGSAQTAAVLSLHALLALDPHGARVQPRPELLFYTPAGFHAAVCKTLMQALQVPSPAAAGAGGQICTAVLPYNQQQQGQGHKQAEESSALHPLQAWSDALFPAWHMWWHIGLLAYGQQQQQQYSMQQAAHTATTSSNASSSTGGVSDLYDSPEARLFAVGYAARQISTSGQLERLLSNPPVAAGLAISPVDWLAVAPAQITCGGCEQVVMQPQQCGAVLCCVCWTWFCKSCFSNRCRSAAGGCEVHPRLKAKAAHKWHILNLLRPNLLLTHTTLQQQQQQQSGQQQQQQLGRAKPWQRQKQQQQPAATLPSPAAAAAAIASPLYIPQATNSSSVLTSTFSNLLAAHAAASSTNPHTSSSSSSRGPSSTQQHKQQQKQKQQQWRVAAAGGQPCSNPLFRQFERAPWGLTGCHEEDSAAGKLLIAAAEEAADKFAVEKRNGPRIMHLESYSLDNMGDLVDNLTEDFSSTTKARTLQRYTNSTLPPRQLRVQQQREQQQRQLELSSFSQFEDTRHEYNSSRYGAGGFSSGFPRSGFGGGGFGGFGGSSNRLTARLPGIGGGDTSPPGLGGSTPAASGHSQHSLRLQRQQQRLEERWQRQEQRQYGAYGSASSHLRSSSPPPAAAAAASSGHGWDTISSDSDLADNDVDGVLGAAGWGDAPLGLQPELRLSDWHRKIAGERMHDLVDLDMKELEEDMDMAGVGSGAPVGAAGGGAGGGRRRHSAWAGSEEEEKGVLSGPGWDDPDHSPTPSSPHAASLTAAAAAGADGVYAVWQDGDGGGGQEAAAGGDDVDDMFADEYNPFAPHTTTSSNNPFVVGAPASVVAATDVDVGGRAGTSSGGDAGAGGGSNAATGAAKPGASAAVAAAEGGSKGGGGRRERFPLIDNVQVEDSSSDAESEP